MLHQILSFLSSPTITHLSSSPLSSSSLPSPSSTSSRLPSSEVCEKEQTRMDGLGTTRHHFQHLLHDDNRNDTGDNQDYEQQHYDGDWSFASGISHLVKDDFLVEDILDLTCILEDSLDQQQPLNFGELEDEEKVGDDDEDGYHSSKYKSSSRLPIDDINPSGPAVPVGDIFDLEWLSQIVDDSIVDLVDLPSSAIISPSHLLLSTTNIYKPRSSGSISNLKPTFTSFSDEALLVPSKSRSKRARKGGHAWSIPHRHMAEPLCSSSVSSSSSCSSTFSLSSCLLFDPKTQNSESILLHVVSPKGRGRGRPPLHKKKDNAETQQKQKQQKKKKKKGRKSKSLITTSEFSEAGILGDGGTNSLRRCSHCGVQKTPQWRAGPKGAKTLCNACGVRYKSGRLLPEYRPAISPTFLDHVHSNSHRKVLEMRRMKELEHQQFLISDSYSSTSTTGAVPLAYSPAAALPSQQQMVF